MLVSYIVEYIYSYTYVYIDENIYTLVLCIVEYMYIVYILAKHPRSAGFPSPPGERRLRRPFGKPNVS